MLSALEKILKETLTGELAEITKRTIQAQQQMKENDSGSLPGESAQQKSSVDSKCPFGVCNGSGVYWDKKEDMVKNCKCRELQISKGRLKFAEIPAEFQNLKVNDFRPEMFQNRQSRETACIAKKAAVSYIQQFTEIEKQGKGLYFYSEAKGSGKTMLAAAMGNAIIQRYCKYVRFITTTHLLDKIRRTFQSGAENSYSKILDEIKRVDVLILDDFGAERPTGWTNEVFNTIFNDRMTAKKITFFTSNCPIEQLVYEERIISRVFRMAMPVKFPEESVRQILARQENEALLQQLLGKNRESE